MTDQRAQDVGRMLEAMKCGRRFSRDELEVLGDFMAVQQFRKGQTILLQGEKGNSMAFVVAGLVEIIKDRTKTSDAVVVTLGPGNHFGELSLIDGEPRSASAVAVEDTTLLTMSREQFDALRASRPELGFKFYEQIAILVSKRLRLTTRELVYRI